MPPLSQVAPAPLSPIQQLDPNTHEVLIAQVDNLGEAMQKLAAHSLTMSMAQSEPEPETTSEKHWRKQKECDEAAPSSQLPSEAGMALESGEEPYESEEEVAPEEEMEQDNSEMEDRLQASLVKQKQTEGDPKRQFNP